VELAIAPLTITNEFASVEICVQESGNGVEAVVTDRRSGTSRRIDVLAFEGLVWAPRWFIDSLADPGLRELADEIQSCEQDGGSAGESASKTGG